MSQQELDLRIANIDHRFSGGDGSVVVRKEDYFALKAELDRLRELLKRIPEEMDLFEHTATSAGRNYARGWNDCRNQIIKERLDDTIN